MSRGHTPSSPLYVTGGVVVKGRVSRQTDEGGTEEGLGTPSGVSDVRKGSLRILRSSSKTGPRTGVEGPFT